MSGTEWVRDLALAWLPTLVVLLLSIGVLALASFLLNRKWKNRGRIGGVGPPLLLLVLTGIAVVTVILTLPIGETAQGQLLSLLGILVTAAIALSSTTFVGNLMAGLMLRAIRNFRAGDFVRVGPDFGRVSEFGLLHTEIQTEDRDLTTLPNLHLVTSPVTVVRSSGTVVSATVSLGYDVPRDEIERHLLEAATRAELADPFVQILELGDYSVTYRCAGFLEEVKFLITVRSRLRACMLDALHENGVEIVSPTFMNQRVFPVDQAFVPRSVGRAPSPVPTEEAAPEAKIFDKAEEAESLAEKELTLVTMIASIEKLEKALAAAKDEEAKALATRELEIAQRTKEALEASIAAAKEENGAKP